jgi:hypothetical protein
MQPRGVHGAPRKVGTKVRLAEAQTARRRFDPSQRPDDESKRDVSPAAKEFFELAWDHLRQLERAAADAAEDLDEALERLSGQLASDGEPEAERLEAIGESLLEHNRTIADRCARIRSRLERSNLHPTIAPSGDGALPEGVALLARQMALQGADPGQIETELSRLGVRHADDAVRDALH